MPNTDFQNGVVLGSVAGGNIQTSAPSGDIEITENGTYDIADKANAIVNVIGGCSNYKNITENQDGTYTVVDSDDVSHIISITEAGGVITATLDGNTIPISLDADGNIIKIGNSNISIAEQSEGKGGYGGVSVIPIQSINVEGTCVLT